MNVQNNSIKNSIHVLAKYKAIFCVILSGYYIKNQEDMVTLD